MNVTWKLALVCALTLNSHHPLSAEETNSKEALLRYVNLQVGIRSWVTGDTLDTYRTHSSGSCSNGGTVGLGVGGKGAFNVDVRCIPDRDRIAAEISIQPSDDNTTLQASDSVVDLSDMRPKFIEVTKDGDERSYFLVIGPEIIEAKGPRAFTTKELAPFDWDFPQSPVVLNDEIYVGRIGMSGGSLAGITIAGVADLQFSLRPLKNAEPIGSLQGGTLTIKTGDDEIVISGVRNGANKQTLEGPFKVWVRSTGEDVTNAQYKRMMSVQLEAIRKRKAEGDASITDEVIDRVKGFVDEGRPMLIGSSASDVRDNDLVN